MATDGGGAGPPLQSLPEQHEQKQQQQQQQQQRQVQGDEAAVRAHALRSRHFWDRVPFADVHLFCADADGTGAAATTTTTSSGGGSAVRLEEALAGDRIVHVPWTVCWSGTDRHARGVHGLRPAWRRGGVGRAGGQLPSAGERSWVTACTSKWAPGHAATVAHLIEDEFCVPWSVVPRELCASRWGHSCAWTGRWRGCRWFGRPHRRLAQVPGALAARPSSAATPCLLATPWCAPPPIAASPRPCPVRLSQSHRWGGAGGVYDASGTQSEPAGATALYNHLRWTLYTLPGFAAPLHARAQALVCCSRRCWWPGAVGDARSDEVAAAEVAAYSLRPDPAHGSAAACLDNDTTCVCPLVRVCVCALADGQGAIQRGLWPLGARAGRHGSAGRPLLLLGPASSGMPLCAVCLLAKGKHTQTRACVYARLLFSLIVCQAHGVLAWGPGGGPGVAAGGCPRGRSTRRAAPMVPLARARARTCARLRQSDLFYRPRRTHARVYMCSPRGTTGVGGAAGAAAQAGPRHAADHAARTHRHTPRQRARTGRRAPAA
jgi:hypothetical protein